MAHWFFGMETGKATASVDLRPGGAYEIVMENEEETHRPHGEYLEIVAGKKLVFTWSSDCYADNSKVTIELNPSGTDQTELVLTHELPTDMIAPHNGGWTNCFNHLKNYLPAGGPGAYGYSGIGYG